MADREETINPIFLPSSNLDTAANKKSIRFVVTGFGPFRGVPTNPTTEITQQLEKFLDETAPTTTTTSSNHSNNANANRVEVETSVLETSVQAVTEFLDNLHVQLDQQQEEDRYCCVRRERPETYI